MTREVQDSSGAISAGSLKPPIEQDAGGEQPLYRPREWKRLELSRDGRKERNGCNELRLANSLIRFILVLLSSYLQQMTTTPTRKLVIRISQLVTRKRGQGQQ